MMEICVRTRCDTRALINTTFLKQMNEDSEFDEHNELLDAVALAAVAGGARAAWNG